MADQTVKVDISFQSLLAAISSLEVAENHQLLELLAERPLGFTLFYPTDNSVRP